MSGKRETKSANRKAGRQRWEPSNGKRQAGNGKRLRWGIVLGVLVTQACQGVTPPDRAIPYAYRLAPQNLAFHWPANRLPVRYWVQPAGALPAMVRAALERWEAQFLYGEFRGAIVADSTAADVRVRFDGPPPPTAEPNDAPPVDACGGTTSLALDPGNRLTAPLDVRVRWFGGYAATDVANCLWRVTAHEIGHSLGLLAHSDDAGDLMFGAPFGFPTAREPSARDRATVQTAYHTPADISPPGL